MELTNKFKMANYLMRNKDVFQKLVAAIQDHKNMELDSRLRATLRMMLTRQRSDAYVKYPETLINIMYTYFGREVAWTLIVDTLRKHHSDFRITDIEAHGLEGLAKHDKYRHSNLPSILENTLANLSHADVNRVKLLLSWEIVKGYNHISYGVIEKKDIYDLADQIYSRQFDHAVYVMTLILTHIEQLDLVVELTSASTEKKQRTRVSPKPK
jgi:hypothetical protein